MDGWLVAGLCLVLAYISGCAGGALETAIRAENVAGTTAIAAHEELKIVCETAVENSSSLDAANKVIAACAKAEDAYAVFRSAWLTAALAINLAQMTGVEPDDLPKLMQDVQTAAQNVLEMIQAIKELASADAAGNS